MRRSLRRHFRLPRRRCERTASRARRTTRPDVLHTGEITSRERQVIEWATRDEDQAPVADADELALLRSMGWTGGGMLGEGDTTDELLEATAGATSSSASSKNAARNKKKRERQKAKAAAAAGGAAPAGDSDPVGEVEAGPS